MSDPVRLEKTSKKLKLMQLISVVAIFVGGGGALYLRGTPQGIQAGMAALGGLGLWLTARFLVWWNYG